MRKVLAGLLVCLTVLGGAIVANASSYFEFTFEGDNFSGNGSLVADFISGSDYNVIDGQSTAIYFDGTTSTDFGVFQLATTSVPYLFTFSNLLSTNPSNYFPGDGLLFAQGPLQLNIFKWGTSNPYTVNIANVPDAQYLTYNGYLGDDTVKFSVTETTAPVPEPATMLLFGTGLAGLVAARRRKKAC